MNQDHAIAVTVIDFLIALGINAIAEGAIAILSPCIIKTCAFAKRVRRTLALSFFQPTGNKLVHGDRPGSFPKVRSQ
ncbi:hypothetical protein [Nostoc sp.]|uniref:hypothetical protein n=1 Tax=Nostoc sp. TaxID=1180 RepID=UPI002FF6AD72